MNNTIAQQRELFIKNGSILIKDIIPKDVCNFLTHSLFLHHADERLNGNGSIDAQVPTSLVTVTKNMFLDTVLEMAWPSLEYILGEELIPTYSYSRLYSNGDVLDPHLDRPSCEVSVTVQLGRSHHYAWPIYAGDIRYDLDEGDGMMYMGCDNPHWRNKCDGPEGYYSGQLFLHYVKAKGIHAEWAGDKRWDGKIPFVRNRTYDMIYK